MEQMRLANSKTITASVVVSLTTNHWSSFLNGRLCLRRHQKKRKEKKKKKYIKHDRKCIMKMELKREVSEVGSDVIAPKRADN